MSLLEELGEVSDELEENIMSQSDSDIIMEWIKKATKVKSIEEFQKIISSEI